MIEADIEKKKEKDSYSDIAKNTTLLASVQIFVIIVNIIRTKFAAIYIGPIGSGNLNIFTSALTLILTFTGLGLTFSAVKFISESNKNQLEILDLNKKIYVSRKLFIYTGFIGMALVILFSKIFSIWIFGNSSYTFSFILLSITIIFQSITNGELAILQGMQNVKKLALINLIIAIIVVLITIPLFYCFKLRAIIPSIIISSIIGTVVSKFRMNYSNSRNFNLSIKEIFTSGVDLIKLGATVMITNLFMVIVGFLTQLFIKHESGFANVGIYTAGLSIISGYIGLIFTSMTTDFFPRLSSNNENIVKANMLVNQQAEFSILIIGPILLLLLFFSPLVIKILYSNEFLPVINFLQFSVIGVLFQTAHWPIGILIASKGKLKLYFLLVTLLHFLSLGTNVVFFKYYNLIGLGYAFLFTHFVILSLAIISTRTALNFKYENEFKKIFILNLFLLVLSLCLIKYLSYPKSYIIAIPICLFSIFHSVSKLKSKLNFTNVKLINLLSFKLFNKSK